VLNMLARLPLAPLLFLAILGLSYLALLVFEAPELVFPLPMIGAARPGRRVSPPADWAGALTARQRDVARLVGKGWTNAEIAEQLHVTNKAVEAHLTRTYQKLGLRSRTELALLVATSSS
jgi:DNA-binding CsgD family transcriptional regulator